MTAPFRVIDDLPPKGQDPLPPSTGDRKALFRVLIANPERWVEAYRTPVTSEALWDRGKRLREYGLETEIRREDEDRVLYVRLVPGSSDGAA